MDVSALGYRAPGYPFVVEAGKVRELARAVGSTQPEYLGAEPIAMPALLKVAQFSWEPQAGSAVARVGFDRRTPPLHARQQFRFLGPPPGAGTCLQVRTIVGTVRERTSRRLGTVGEVVLESDYRDSAGTLVAQARTTSVQPLSAAAAVDPPVAPAAAGPRAPDRDRLIGPITQTEVVRYQGASGDFNPVHHDPALARAAGWPAVLVPGLYLAAILCDRASEQHGAARIRELDVRFRAPVWLGETLLAVVGPPRQDQAGRLRVDLAAHRSGDGFPVTTGTAGFVTDEGGCGGRAD